MKQCKYLIVGGGMTADAAVKGIREVDEKGDVTILSAESDPPYDRPPLTKGLWTKGTPIEKIWRGTEAKGAKVILATRAVALDLTRQEVVDDKAEVYRFQRLLLATGGKPKRLPFGNSTVIYYRTCADYRRLRALTEQGKRFVVIGGGFIGSEIAAALAVNGMQVVMIFPEAAICGRILPPSLALALDRYYTARGVRVLAGRKPSGIQVERGFSLVRCEDGQVFPADGIVAGLGIDPHVELAVESGLEVNNGLVVNAQLRTKHPHVFAAGDVANFYNPALDSRMRVEHEDNALIMGRTAGRNMAGEEQPYHHLPYFYSDLFDAGYEALGETSSSLEMITEVAQPQDKGPIFYLKNGRVRGIIFWNLFGKLEAGRALIAAPGPHTKESLKAWARERLG